MAKSVQGRKYCICTVSASDYPRATRDVTGQGSQGWRRKPGGLGVHGCPPSPRCIILQSQQNPLLKGPPGESREASEKLTQLYPATASLELDRAGPRGAGQGSGYSRR